MSARSFFTVSLGVLVLALIAGCGSSGSNSTSATTGGSSTVSSGQGGSASVDVVSNPKLGSILVDAQGNTLYLFQKDSGGKSSCSGSCASVWPPVSAGTSPKAGSGVDASKLGTVKRDDGTMQVTYAGHPLYTYTADTSPGQVTGNGINTFGGVWNAVTPSGSNAPAGTTSSAGATSSQGGATTSSGGGYGY